MVTLICVNGIIIIIIIQMILIILFCVFVYVLFPLYICVHFVIGLWAVKLSRKLIRIKLNLILSNPTVLSTVYMCNYFFI
jgi:hypothetical protein